MRTRMLLCLTAAGLAAPSAAQAAERLAAVSEDDTLVLLRSDAPGQVDHAVPLSGLAAGDRIVGLDVRPADDVLYGLGASSRIYTIEAGSGQARAVGLQPFAPPLSGTSFGFDFNPTVDRIRVVSDTGQDLRLNPDTGAVAAVDGALAYAAGDPGAAVAPNVTAAAYTNSVPGATSTTLYDLDAARDALVVQSPPNAGTLNTVGPLGIDIAGPAGFDIAPDGTALAALRRAGQPAPELFRIDLAAGTATAVGMLPTRTASTDASESPITAIAVLGPAPDDTAAPQVTAAITSPQSVRRLRDRPISVRVACDESCTVTATLRVRGQDVGTATGSIPATAGRLTIPVALDDAGRRALGADGVRRVRIAVTATDAAGNVATVARTLRVRR